MGGKNQVPDPLPKTYDSITTELGRTTVFGPSWGGVLQEGWREEGWREEGWREEVFCWFPALNHSWRPVVLLSGPGTPHEQNHHVGDPREQNHHVGDPPRTESSRGGSPTNRTIAWGTPTHRDPPRTDSKFQSGLISLENIVW